jgi:YidC/Oxa1 family membrane protein insertase
MERRLLIVFALTFVIIILAQPLLRRYLPQQPPATTQQQPTQVSTPPSTPAQEPPPAEQKSAAPKNRAAIQATSEDETVVENDLYKITFSNRGGLVKSWVLKKYDDDAGKPLELVNAAASTKLGYPMSLWTYDQGVREKLNSSLYVPSAKGTLSAPATVSFEYSDQDLSVVKKFSFDHSYVVNVETSVHYKGAELAAMPAWPSGLGDETSPAAYGTEQIEMQNGDKVERLAIKKVSGGATLTNPFHWAGVTDRYFAAVFIPNDSQSTAVVTLRNALDVPKNPEKPNPQDTTSVQVLGAAAGSLRGQASQRIFVGPKSLAVLESVRVPGVPDHPDLRQLVNFGFFGIIARALFIWLKWTYVHMVSNWGWAIVLQTFIITMALLPLRISQMKSMLKMQKAAPVIKSIQEKYKKYSLRDPRKQQMQQEIAAVYKEHGVNPAGGCLPMLVQLPFLWAYYAMLGSAIDLRHAHWLWVRDLSAADPLHLLPIGIIVTMFLTQKMTPSAGMDPTQQKMMNFMMPVMLGIISWNLAAGLCLYWSESNIIAMVQQVVMNRTTLGKEMREMMEKRARKAKK